MPAAERFLARMGRRKFVSPLFETLLGAGEWGRPIAERTYARTRPGYHSVTTAAVDRLLRGESRRKSAVPGTFCAGPRRGDFRAGI